MNYLLDTNACIRLLNGTSPRLAEKFRSQSPSRIRLCSIVKVELCYGAFKSQQPAEMQRKLRRFFAPLKSLPFDDDCAEQAGTLRVELGRLGTPIGPNDLLIAATALAYEVTLVTHNTREFSRVQGLSFEDWES
ncbi:MAG: type II toxin-antitoxin system tRNA(fMet)-specific endonuclease VapC [Candidatus Xenobia bacterium]